MTRRKKMRKRVTRMRKKKKKQQYSNTCNTAVAAAPKQRKFANGGRQRLQSFSTVTKLDSKSSSNGRLPR